MSAFTIYPLSGEYFSVADEEAINAALAASGVRYTAEEPSELIDLRAEVEGIAEQDPSVWDRVADAAVGEVESSVGARDKK